MISVGSLCTGYGGIEMGLAWAGLDLDTRWIAEIEPALAPLHGRALNLGDIAHVDWSDVEPVDLLTAGFPCQPTSAAGRRLGDADQRWLWPEVARAIQHLRPERVLIENVRNLVSYDGGRLWAAILEDLTGFRYQVRWLTLGACHVGAAHHRHRVFLLALRYRTRSVLHVPTTFCGARGGSALPTPTARDGDDRGRGEGSPDYWARRGQERTNGVPLGAAVRALLPTPRATDGVNGGPGQRGRRGDLALPSATQPQHWGRFDDAVARHEALYGPAPAPTEPNRNGAPRLAPAFAEWLMCLPAGHVTAKLDRVPALRAIGNGVCPPQLAAAWGLLTEGLDR